MRTIIARCPRCRESFSYQKGTGRFRVYCSPCGHEHKLERMRILNKPRNAEYRRLEKIRLGLT